MVECKLFVIFTELKVFASEDIKPMNRTQKKGYMKNNGDNEKNGSK